MFEVELCTWMDDLNWCPSQCYYYFFDPTDGGRYCIYLRWRHRDPWSAELVPCDSDWEFDYQEDWEPIKTSRDYKDYELEDLKEEVLKVTGSKFPGFVM